MHRRDSFVVGKLRVREMKKILTTYKTTIGIISVLTLILSAFDLFPGGADAAATTVVDSLGRQVTVPDRIERIACMYAFTGHVVAMLGKASTIVAVSNGLQRDVLFTSMYPAIRQALVPKYQGAINVEELAKAEPDVVFVAADTGRNAAEAARMDACGLAWLAIDFHTMEQQQRAIGLIGAAIGASEKAAAYNCYYQTCIERTRQAVAAIPSGKRVRVYHATVEATRTSSPDSLPADWIQAAGVTNVAVQEPARMLDGENRVSIEQILLWNPEVILANEPGVADAIRKSPQWSAIAAVQNGRVYQMPIGISRWGHPGSLETPLAILWTAQTVYPDMFRTENLPRELRYFYHTFFNHELSDNMIEQILHGQGMRLTKDRKKKQK